MDRERLRDLLSALHHRLRRNKVLEDNPWAARFVLLSVIFFFSGQGVDGRRLPFAVKSAHKRLPRQG